MCQPVIGETITFTKPRKMWKVVMVRIGGALPDSCSGPYHNTTFRKDGWAYTVTPRAAASIGPPGRKKTQAGYHVFASKRGARAYAKETGNPNRKCVAIPVYIEGKAIPFRWRNYYTGKVSKYKGYAVQRWRRANAV